MYLKNLQMIGFKSFAEKTTLEFLPGVTAIVGPNGCGKSNVSDAIRWVLGEQSAKALRGGEMADVIFNGTDQRKAFGMAEVSLTFSNCKEVLKTGQLGGTDVNFDEVTVARRIFRNGNSEYLINKTPCRLRDVQSLFMDTGIGRSSYSIMEQGKIDKILSSHPEDLRAVFEEAAGITKFKFQKKEAIRKLEYTETNLVRVSDIIKEVKRQINSLQRQASKARRYQALSAEIKFLDTQLSRYEFEKIQSSIQGLERSAEELRTKADDIRLEIEAGEGRITNLREQLTLAENSRQEVFQKQRDLQSEIERQESRIHMNADRISETEASIQVTEKQVNDARSRSIEFQSKLGGCRATLQRSNEELRLQAEELEEAQRLFQEADRAEKEGGSVIQQLQGVLLRLEGDLANLRNQIATLEKYQKDIVLGIQKTGGERSIILDEKQKLSQRLESLRTEIGSYKSIFETSRHALMGGEDAVREAEYQSQLLSSRVIEEQRILSEKTSRRDVLLQLQKTYEGYSEGAQALLRQRDEDSKDANDRKRILGSLVNFIEVEPRFSIAIEAGLGQILQSIVVLEFQTVLSFVEKLRNQDLGGALFAIQEATSHDSSSSFHRDVLEGTICWAGDVVFSQPSVAPLVKKLLADSVIVQDLAKAIELSKIHPGITFLTIDGDVLNYHGILSAGSRKTSPLQLIGRRNEIISLEAEIKQAEELLHELSVQKGEWEGRRALARQSLGNRQTELRLQENDLAKKETLIENIQNELRELELRIQAAHAEIQDLEKQKGENDLTLVGIRGELTQAESEQAKVQVELMSSRQRLEELALERYNCSVASNDLRVSHATTHQQIQSLESQIQQLESQASETQQFLASREADIRTGRQRILQWNGENAEATQKITILTELKVTLAKDLSKVEGEKNRLNTEIQSLTDSLRAYRQRTDEIQKELMAHEVQLVEKRGGLEHLSERILREYNIDLLQVNLLELQGSESSSSAEEVDASISEIKDDPSLESVESNEVSSVSKIKTDFLNFSSWENLSLRVTELRAKIQGMGPVNLESVQEYDELEERHTFLTREHQDLITSKEQLLQILQKINITTQKMFSETFEKIRQNFLVIFVELFGGGRADLILMDEADPLECGIEIVAKPLGKQLQSIMLFSGGEKTMTAVALLFAIYMVRPSPFCVLDEMDAPLDELNINRFVKMLQRFLEHSQFLIITHNKRTIAMADALYGVTMEERGVSKIVSVKFHKAAEEQTASRISMEQDHSNPSSTGAESPSRLSGRAMPVGSSPIQTPETSSE